MSLFFDIVDAVEENNKINNGQWKDWYSFHHIVDTYEINTANETRGDLSVVKALIDALIRDNGKNLDIYISAMDCLSFGMELTRQPIQQKD